MRIAENVYVRMRDDLRISLDIFRPDGEERVPAILSMSPYGKETQRFRPPGAFASVEAGDTDYFVQHGYAHVLMDSRGSAPSEGQWALASPDEQQDGYEIVEWLAAQPWCSGKVAMVGGSYYGHIQFLVAATQPPHLATIVPMNGWTDLYRDFVFHGGLLHGFSPGWVAGVMEQTRPALNDSQPDGWQPSADVLSQVMALGGEDGPFFRERSAMERLDKITIPVYHMVSTASYNHYRGQLLAYARMDCPQKLMLFAGNLRRALYTPAFSAEIVRWLDQWTKDVDTGIMREPPITLFVQGSNAWRFERSYPLARTDWTRSYLHSQARDAAASQPWGLLTQSPPAMEEDTDSFDYPQSAARVADDEPVLAYLTEPFAQDTEIIGPASLVLYASTTTVDTAVIVKLDDVAPNGQITPVTKGWLRASHREVDAGASGLAQPYHPHTNATPLVPGEIYEIEIEIWPMCRSFEAGHQLRLRIASSDSRVHDLANYHFTVEKPLRVTVHHSKDHPSHLLLPFVPPDREPLAERPSIDFTPQPARAAG